MRTVLKIEGLTARKRSSERLRTGCVCVSDGADRVSPAAGFVDLITGCAKAEGVELKDVVNLAFHERFEQGQCPPPEE
jgi:hypothetical protein